MRIDPPVSFGVAGLGGYAAAVAKMLLAQAKSASPPVKLVCACDPDLPARTKEIEFLQSQGVAIYDSFDAMLASPVEAVWLPVPIDLHRPFTEKALAAGKAVMCEKPATGCIDDLDAMIAARDRAKLPVGIGFQDTHADTTTIIKRRLLGGEIGRIDHVTVQACWPREDEYYNRATWAGALQRHGIWVLDSPAQNAIAHFITLPLFLLGTTMPQAATPLAIEAELYRARPSIASYDTICMRITLPDDVTLLVMMTHACTDTIGPIVTFHGERGTMTRTMNEATCAPAGGTPTMIRVGDKHGDMVRRFAACVRGQVDPDHPVVSLELARPQLVCVNAAVQCTPIHAAPSRHNARGVYAIDNIEAIFAQCAQRNEMLHETGLAPWSKPAGKLDVRDYRHFAGPCGRPA